MKYEDQNVAGSRTIVVTDVNNDIGQGQYLVIYWLGIRTTEAGSGGLFEMFFTDQLSNLVPNGHQSPINGADAGGISGSFVVDYGGSPIENPNREIRFEIGISSPLNILRYDYRIILYNIG